MWGGVLYTPMYVDEGTPRVEVPCTLTPWESISGTRTIGYLKCPTKRMRSVFGPGQPVRGQWVLTFRPPGEEAFIINIYRSHQRDRHKDWNISATYWLEEWNHTMEIIEGVTSKCQAIVNKKLVAVAGAVFGCVDVVRDSLEVLDLDS